MSLYVSVSEFKQMPTGIDCSNLDQTNFGNQAAQDNTLLNILRRASSWANSIVQQDTLEVTTNTEIKEVYMSKDGRVNIHVNCVPIIDLLTVEYRVSPSDTWRSINLSDIQVQDSWFTIYNLMPTSIASDIFYGINSPYFRKTDIPIMIRYTYTNGWVNTVLSVDALANATMLTIDDSTGIKVGAKLTIYDGPSQENVVVSAINGNTITLKNPLLFPHNKGIYLSAIPENVKQATTLLAMYLIKERGSIAVTMQESAISSISYNSKKSDDLTIAREMLSPYKRVVTS